MMKDKDDLLTLTPLENYEAPSLPTYADDKPNLEKKVPSRWKNKAMVATAIGLLGTATLASCDRNATRQNELPNLSFLNDQQHCWMHHGGSGGAPLYVAYLTEQEAIGIVRAELELAGISFTEDAPPYHIEIDDTEVWGDIHHVGINLFNEVHNIGLSIVEPDVFHIPFSRFEMDEVSGQIEHEFEENYPDLSLGLFCNPTSWIGWGYGDDDAVTAEEKAEARERLVANLVDQVQAFTHQLREAGIID